MHDTNTPLQEEDALAQHSTKTVPPLPFGYPKPPVVIHITPLPHLHALPGDVIHIQVLIDDQVTLHPAAAAAAATGSQTAQQIRPVLISSLSSCCSRASQIWLSLSLSHLGVTSADVLDDGGAAGGVDGEVVRHRQAGASSSKDGPRLLRRHVAGLQGKRSSSSSSSSSSSRRASRHGIHYRGQL
jgi:hypothetical protein